MNPKDIYLVRAKYRHCEDIRPCLILEICNIGKVRLALISSAFDLYKDRRDFLIEASHPDFAATGLRKTSYIARIKDTFLATSPENLGKPLGQLVRGLAIAFDDWMQ